MMIYFFRETCMHSFQSRQRFLSSTFFVDVFWPWIFRLKYKERLFTERGKKIIFSSSTSTFIHNFVGCNNIIRFYPSTVTRNFWTTVIIDNTHQLRGIYIDVIAKSFSKVVDAVWVCKYTYGCVVILGNL